MQFDIKQLICIIKNTISNNNFYINNIVFSFQNTNNTVIIVIGNIKLYSKNIFIVGI